MLIYFSFILVFCSLLCLLYKYIKYTFCCVFVHIVSNKFLKMRERELLESQLQLCGERERVVAAHTTAGEYTKIIKWKQWIAHESGVDVGGSSSSIYIYRALLCLCIFTTRLDNCSAHALYIRYESALDNDRRRRGWAHTHSHTREPDPLYSSCVC